LHDLSQYDRKNARAETILSMGRHHLLVNGFVVATEGDMCRDPDLREIPEKRLTGREYEGWTPERLIEAATGSAR